MHVNPPWSYYYNDLLLGCLSYFSVPVFVAYHVETTFRWHNHLNPGINKEAWTQDEELALIRAHQMYGNKWAELTKFLPGRYAHTLCRGKESLLFLLKFFVKQNEMFSFATMGV